MFNNNLILFSKSDIPFYNARINIHQPTIKEISLIGEEEFHFGVRILLINKNNLVFEDDSDSEDITNFNIFMSVMSTNESFSQRTHALMVLTLLFPTIEFKVKKDRLLFLKEKEEENECQSFLCEENFAEFQSIISKMFCMDEMMEENSYNPADELAKKIADKLKKSKQKVELKKESDNEQKIDLFSRYISILSVGLQKDMNTLFEYTVYSHF